jgi:hypothetical protein
MKIQSIVRRLYWKFEESLWSLCTDLIMAIEKNVDNAQIQRKISEVRYDLDMLSRSIILTRKSTLSIKIAVADSARYSSYITLRAGIESDLTRFQNPDIQKNAEHLAALIHKVEKKAHDNKLDLSTMLMYLFESFNQPVNWKRIKENGIRDIYEELQLMQSKFQTLCTPPEHRLSQKENVPVLRIAAHTLITSLEEKLFRRIEICAEDCGEPYNDLIVALNKTISVAEQMQRSRITQPFNELEYDFVLADVVSVKPLHVHTN